VADSVLDAIKLGFWDFEPEQTKPANYNCTKAMPGTQEKLSIMVQRIQKGLPLWHPEDRRSYDDADEI
jgi:hypothetical protein